ncbi:hypothetical protein AGMMS49545_18230 [Betaproteobacteria bacterium]|nr:hypothetical protein AGMMS49545_18230 [Betaproteobacteria bacterium]
MSKKRGNDWVAGRPTITMWHKPYGRTDSEFPFVSRYQSKYRPRHGRRRKVAGGMA